MGTKAATERIRARIAAAVDDVRQNGRQGRTIAEIAGQFKVKAGTLKVRLSQAGLLGQVPATLSRGRNAKNQGRGANNGQATNPGDSLEIKGLSSGIPASGEIQGGEGGNPLGGPKGSLERASSDEDRLKVLTSAVRRVIESSIRAGAKVLKCETPGDLERLYKLYRETFKSLDGESSAPGRGLIQVQILGDASAPAPRQVRVIEAKAELISESPSDSVPVSLPSQAGQGPE